MNFDQHNEIYRAIAEAVRSGQIHESTEREIAQNAVAKLTLAGYRIVPAPDEDIPWPQALITQREVRVNNELAATPTDSDYRKVAKVAWVDKSLWLQDALGYRIRRTGGLHSTVPVKRVTTAT